jgi:predicted DNA binding protein
VGGENGGSSGVADGEVRRWYTYLRSDAMTKDAIIAEIRKLTTEEQREIVETFSAAVEDDYGLTEEELETVQNRLKRYHDHPETGVSMEEMAQRHGL